MPVIWNEKLANALVAKELTMLGDCEDPPGSNRGKVPDAVYKFVHGPNSDPADDSEADRQWCAGFLCTCAYAVGIRTFARTMSTGAIWDWGKANNSTLLMPRMGDAGLRLNPATRTGFDHTVTVEHNFGDGFIHYIAGNEGNCVARGIMPIERFKFVRPYKQEDIPK